MVLEIDDAANTNMYDITAYLCDDQVEGRDHEKTAVHSDPLLRAPALLLAQTPAQDPAPERSDARRSLHRARASRLEGRDHSGVGRHRLAPTTGGLDPAAILRPLSGEWLSYSGDLSGKRYSPLRQVSTTTVKNLSPQVDELVHDRLRANRAERGRQRPAGGGGGGGGGAAAPIVVGGFGTGDLNTAARPASAAASSCTTASSTARPPTTCSPSTRATARCSGSTSGSRAAARRSRRAASASGATSSTSRCTTTGSSALDAKTGKEVWRHEIAPFEQQYFSSNVPMVVGDHMLVGTGNDTDAPSFLKSLNPRTGAVEWIIYSTPQKEGDPGLETWASLDAARHGNGATWIPGSYDPETKLYIYGTGNPTPSYTQGRGEGDNLFTGALLAVQRRYGQDGVVLPDVAARHATTGIPRRRRSWWTPCSTAGMRKLVMTATRNGYFFVLDRVTGEHLVTSKLGLVNNWAPGPRREGAAEAQSEQGRHGRRVARQRRRAQLSAADVLARYRSVLRARAELDADQLPDGSRSARLDGPGRHRRRRQPQLRHEHRRGGLQDGEDHLAQAAERRQRRAAHDGWRVAVPEQRPERRGLGRQDGHRPLVLADRRPLESGRRRSCSTASSTCSSPARPGCTSSF